MTSLITPDDVAAATGLTFNAEGESGAELDAAEVQTIIDDLERELRARLSRLGFGWPTAGTDAAGALRTGLLKGAKATVLSSIYTLSDASTTPGGVDRSAREYADWLKSLPDLLHGLMAESPTTAGRGIPRAVRPRHSPNNYQDLEDFTRRRDPLSGSGPWARRWPR